VSVSGCKRVQSVRGCGRDDPAAATHSIACAQAANPSTPSPGKAASTSNTAATAAAGGGKRAAKEDAGEPAAKRKLKQGDRC